MRHGDAPDCKPGEAGAEAADALADWFRRSPGRELASLESQVLADLIANLFGYHLLVVSPPWRDMPLDASRIPHKVVLDRRPGPGNPSLVGAAEALPVLSDSLDAVVLPHTLDRSGAPHQVLREVDRCLIPEGHVVILGFNPWGIWGLVRMLIGWRGRIPWCLRYVSAGRLRDWLALLGFDVLLVRPIFYRPPLSSATLLSRLDGLERLAGCRYPLPAAAYVLLARKRVIGVTPIRPRWRPRRSLMAPGLIKPTSRETTPLRVREA